MSKRTRDLGTMVDLVSSAFLAAQARLGALKRREASLRQTLVDLSASRSNGTDSSSLDDPAGRAGADLLWNRWVDGRRNALNIELLNVLVDQAKCRKSLKKEFGRYEAIMDLQKRARNEDHKERERRADRLRHIAQ